MTTQVPSRFLKEIPTKLSPRHDASHWNSVDFNLFFSRWLGIKQKPSDVVTFGPAVIAKKEQPKKSTWKRNQPVKHATFGVGLIKKIEKKANITYITAEFKTGTKKIKADFLQSV